MKTKKVFLTMFIVLLFILTACSNNDTNEFISSVKEASEKSSQLENGNFSYTYVVGDGNENEASTQATDGIFVVKDDNVDWHSELVIGEGDNKTLMEIIQKDKTQYQRFGRINEDYQFIGEDNQVLTEVLEWQIVNEDTVTYPDYLESLMDLEINEKDIEKAEKKEENNLAIYEFTYNESYLSTVKQNNISEIKEQLDKVKEEEADPNIISALEISLSNNENITFKSIELILTVDDSGVLIGKELQSSFEQIVSSSSQNIQTTERVEILEYNEAGVKVEL